MLEFVYARVERGKRMHEAIGRVPQLPDDERDDKRDDKRGDGN